MTLEQHVELLGSPNWHVRHDALAVLSQAGKGARDMLIKGLSHPNWRVRTWCAELMDHLGDDQCVEPLTRALRDPVSRVRSAAVHAIACQRCKASPLQTDVVAHLIERALTDVSIRVRRKAAHHLGLQPRDSRAVAALRTILEQESDRKLLFCAEWALQQQEGMWTSPSAHS
jgi:HEAT repeat protein